MSERLSKLVRQLRRAGADPVRKIEQLTLQERCYVALSAPRYEYLPEQCPDPVEAWHHLNAEQQLDVCYHRGWPEEWVWEDTARPLADLAGAWAALTEAGVPWRGRLYLHSVTGRIRELAAERDRLHAEVARLQEKGGGS